MPSTPRHFAPLMVFLGVAATAVLTPMATADPDIDGESAAAVIEELQDQGYVVKINGVPSGDTTLLTTCKVTTIHNSGNPSPDPTSTTTVSVDIACPISRG